MRRQRIGHVELFEDDVRRVFDVGRAGVPDMARRMASWMISSVWSAYSMDALYLTDGAKSGSWRTN